MSTMLPSFLHLAADAPIVCIPHAGGGASTFAPWRRSLGRRLLSITLPGREEAHAQCHLGSIKRMAEFVGARLNTAGQPPAVLVGHSMGALVAYEVARQAQEARSGAVIRLIVSGCQAPDRFSADGLSSIPDDGDFLRAVADYDGLPRDLLDDPTLVAYALPILRADLAACDSYAWHPSAPLEIPVLVIGGTGDLRVPLGDLEGWRGLTSAGCTVRTLAGNHFFIRSHAETVLAMVLDWCTHEVPAA